MPASAETVEQRLHSIKMKGKEVFKIAVKGMSEALVEAANRAGLKLEDITHVIPHQANLRIIQAIADRLEVPDEKLVINVDKYSNTGAASVIIGLDEALRSGRIKSGDSIAMAAFGAGLALASAVVRW